MTATRTALLDAAEDAVRQRGFDGFSYADLAKCVGIQKASIHYHFATKAILSAELVDRYRKTLETRCAEIERDQGTAARRLLALISLYRDALAGGDRMCLCVALVSSRQSLPDDTLQSVAAFRKMMTGWIAAVFELGKKDQSIKNIGNPMDEASAFFATLEGAQLAARSVADVCQFDTAIALYEARLNLQ